MSAGSSLNLGPTLSGWSEPAEVQSIDPYECSGFQTDTCRRVGIEILSGPETGTSGRLELGTGAIDPELAVGDQAPGTNCSTAAPGA